MFGGPTRRCLSVRRTGSELQCGVPRFTCHRQSCRRCRMTRMTTRAMLLLALSLPICVWGLQTQPSQKPPAVSSGAPPLPPPPELDMPKDALLPPPPPPLTGYPKRLDYSLSAGQFQIGSYQDIILPPGQIRSVKWVALGPAQTDVSSGVEVLVYSPSFYFRTSPSGTSETFIGPGNQYMRVFARRKDYKGAFLVNVSIDLGQPQ